MSKRSGSVPRVAQVVSGKGLAVACASICRTECSGRRSASSVRRSPAAGPRSECPRQGASWSLEALAPEIPIPHSIGLNLQKQCPERDMDFPAREHFRSDGGFCRVRALAKVLAEKSGQRLKLCN